ncbi:hypothetical protein [Yinghuangia sp. YIM S09857]|uniref:hypothetical protein n=1 Tax=Yinghuangia sp. YIM S09857 TaxID=3436929 RepID=UPI003F53B053
MRVLLTGRMDNDAANEAIANGTMPKLLQSLVEQIKPEAAYFTTTNGQRTCFFVFDMQDSSQMPSIGEKLFSNGMSVAIRPVMNLEDLQKGLAAIDR